MAVQVEIQRHFAVGQKSSSDPGPYGRGFNYVVTAVFPWGIDEAAVVQDFEKILSFVDHHHLGLDSGLIGDPTAVNLAEYLYAQTKKIGAEALRLARGDGLVLNCRD